MAGGSKGRRGAKSKKEAPKGGGAELPEGVQMEDYGESRYYVFNVGQNEIEFNVGAASNGYAGIGFTVNGWYDRGDLQGRDADRAALKIARIMKYDAATRPNGFKYETSAWTGDGFGARRAQSYERAGFSAPDTGKAGGYQRAIVKDGKLTPYTP